MGSGSFLAIHRIKTEGNFEDDDINRGRCSLQRGEDFVINDGF